jgi:protein TonB
MYPLKSSDIDLKRVYQKNIEVGLIWAIVIVLIVIRLIPEINTQELNLDISPVELELTEIPPTEQMIKPPPPPARPAIPIPTEDETIPDDLTIEENVLDFNLADLTPPPPPDQEEDYENYVFIPYDEAPAPIGGYNAILAHIKYPEIARKAGVEATVVTAVLIDENGNSVKTQVLKDAGSTLGFEKAAEEALMKMRWKPAKQRDRAIKVWLSIPIMFRLRNLDKHAS